MAKAITITLTAREAEALLQATYLSTASYDGCDDLIDRDVRQDLKAWERIENKIINA
jgi:hypothetical protein